ncbi:hypothetical protein CISG_03757 [Coccidioides immitis RMSCC 3703]|uniref:Uncharacterized protein n=1 Tax=Coccidioides immitis RMSCC 3703 TaxID=454286 RepID=A0A0J8TJ08_COCIT|nr:hypothetical protein CISG_03757 [Coccidioides immitis RMSCC 3703]
MASAVKAGSTKVVGRNMATIMPWKILRRVSTSTMVLSRITSAMPTTRTSMQIISRIMRYTNMAYAHFRTLAWTKVNDKNGRRVGGKDRFRRPLGVVLASPTVENVCRRRRWLHRPLVASKEGSWTSIVSTTENDCWRFDLGGVHRTSCPSRAFAETNHPSASSD